MSSILSQLNFAPVDFTPLERGFERARIAEENKQKFAFAKEQFDARREDIEKRQEAAAQAQAEQRSRAARVMNARIQAKGVGGRLPPGQPKNGNAAHSSPIWLSVAVPSPALR